MDAKTIVPPVREELLKWKAHLEKSRKRRKIKKFVEETVICHLNGSPMVDFSRTWEQAKKMAGLKDFHFHDLRHTFCTGLRRNGADIKTIKDLIGHKDIRMTERYTHIITEEETRFINKLSDHYQK